MPEIKWYIPRTGDNPRILFSQHGIQLNRGAMQCLNSKRVLLGLDVKTGSIFLKPVEVGGYAISRGKSHWGQFRAADFNRAILKYLNKEEMKPTLFLSAHVEDGILVAQLNKKEVNKR